MISLSAIMILGTLTAASAEVQFGIQEGAEVNVTEVQFGIQEGAEVNVTEGGDLRLTCHEGVYYSLQWYHNGTSAMHAGTMNGGIGDQIDFDENVHISTLTNYGITVEGMNAGNYTCMARSMIPDDDYQLEEHFYHVEVHIVAAEPVPVAVQAEMTSVPTGGTISISCIGDKRADLGWYVNGMPITAGSRVTMSMMSNSESSYIRAVIDITNVTVSDAGTYSCRNSNDYFDQASVVITVTARQRNVTIVHPDSDSIQVAGMAAFSLGCRGQGTDPLVWSLNGQQLFTDLSSGLFITQATNVVDDTVTSLLTKTAYDGVTAVYRCHDEADDSFMDEITVMGLVASGLFRFLIDEDELCPTEGQLDVKVAFSARSSATYQMSSAAEVVILDRIHTNLGCALRMNGSAAPAMFVALMKGAYTFQVVTSTESNDVVPILAFHNAQEVMKTGARGHVGTSVAILTLEVGDTVTLKVAPASPGLLDRLTGGLFSSAPMSQVTFTGYLLYRL